MSAVTILIVEDDKLTSFDLMNSLQSAGYVVHDIVSTGEEAVEKARSLAPDIILIDIKLAGGIDGIETVRRIQRTNEIPVIYVTAYTEQNIFQRARETNPYGYLVKPVKHDDLYNSIETALQRFRLEKKLRESEERFRAIFEQTTVGMCQATLAGKFIRVNQRFCEITGYAREELTSMRFSDIIHPDDHESSTGESRTLTGGKIGSYTEQRRYIKKGGSIIWINLTVSLMRTPTGTPIEIIGVIDDVTERKLAEQSLLNANELLEQRVRQRTERLDKTVERLGNEIEERKKTEEALRRSELKFRTVSDFTYDWEYWLDLEGNTIYVSPSCERITGYKPDDFTADRDLISSIVHPEDREQYDAHSLQEFSGREQHAIGFTIIDKNGTQHRIAHACTPVFDDSGRLTGRRVSNRDVTEQRLTEIKLREGEEVARALINTPSEPVLLVDDDATIVDANDEFVRRLDLPKSAVIGKPISAFLDESSAYLRHEKINAVLKSGKAIRYEEKLIDSWYDTIIYPVPDHRGRITKVAIFSHDITDTRRMQKEIMEISELERQRIGQDLHDGLGQKLTGIAFLTEALKRSMADKGYPELSDVDEIIANISESIDHARKISSGLWTARLEAYDIEEALQELAEDTERLFGISCPLTGGLDYEIRNSTAVANLYYITRESINNAIKHGRATRIEIRLHEDGEFIYLEISDNGSGARADSPTGKGIGMRIMQYRADIIGGRLSTRSSDKGFTVLVSIKKEFIDAYL